MYDHMLDYLLHSRSVFLKEILVMVIYWWKLLYEKYFIKIDYTHMHQVEECQTALYKLAELMVHH